MRFARMGPRHELLCGKYEILPELWREDGGMSVEKLMAVLLAVTMVAFCTLIVTGCVVGVYALVGLVM